jgi:hypothetical protein
LRRTIDIIAAVVLLVAGSAVWLVATDRLRPHHPRFSKDLAAQVVTNLTSGDPTRVRQAIAWPRGQAIDLNIVAGLATAQISFDANAFPEGARNGAAIPGALRIANGPSMPYTFYFVELNGRWLFFDGLPNQPESASLKPVALTIPGLPDWSSPARISTWPWTASRPASQT